MNNLAKQLVDDDGDAVPYPSWHLVVEHCGDETRRDETRRSFALVSLFTMPAAAETVQSTQENRSSVAGLPAIDARN